MPEDRPEAASVRYYRGWAERGDSEAQYNLGLIFDTSFSPIPGASQDNAEAANWYRRAAEKGHARAQYQLAEMYETGRGVSLDLNQAIDLYRRAAAKEDSGAIEALRRLKVGVAEAIPPGPEGRQEPSEVVAIPAQPQTGEIFILRPGVWGFSIDLKQAWRQWLKPALERRRGSSS